MFRLRAFVSAAAAAGATVLLASSPVAADSCPPLYEKGVIGLDWQPAFLHADDYNDGDGLTVTSFRNVFVKPGGTPPIGYYARDQVARIPGIGQLDLNSFDPSADLQVLTDPYLPPGVPFGATVWPNEAERAPDGVFPFEAVVIPQGFHPALFPGRLTAVNVATLEEYVIHQSTESGMGPTFPLDPNNSPRFYHRALFHDMNGDGLEDIVTVRSGFRVGPYLYPPFSELVYFENPGAALDANTPWKEVILYGGPAAGFLGPDIHLDMFDFEDDGVPEVVATHYFTGAPTVPGGPPPMNGKISIYGAPVGGTWADVDALKFQLPRVADISTDQGFPFGVQIVDLNRDGRADVLASNHQPDGCTPASSSPVPGRVYALEQPASGDLFNDPWTTHILLDNIRPNPSMPGQQPPGRLAPGSAKVFWPIRLLQLFIKPWIVVGGDEASRVWVLRPTSTDCEDWSYTSAVVFDINDFYGPGTSQTPLADPFGATISTIGGVATRYDSFSLLAFAELYIPVFEGRDIHVMTFRPSLHATPVDCPVDQSIACPVAE